MLVTSCPWLALSLTVSPHATTWLDLDRDADPEQLQQHIIISLPNRAKYSIGKYNIFDDYYRLSQSIIHLFNPINDLQIMSRLQKPSRVESMKDLSETWLQLLMNSA